MRILSDNNADVNAVDEAGNTPLHKACAEAQVAVVRELLAHKARVEIANHDGRVPAHLASESGQRDVLQLLIEHNARLSVPDHVRTVLQCR